MNSSKKILLLLTVLSGLSLSSEAQHLYVRQQNGTQQSYDIANVTSIKFAPNSVYIHKSNGVDSYALDLVRYINFTDLMVGITDKQVKPVVSFLIFPNPAHTELNIAFETALVQNASVTVYTIDGKTAFRQLLQRNSKNYQLPISGLQPGIYFCSIHVGANTYTQKFIKNER